MAVYDEDMNEIEIGDRKEEPTSASSDRTVHEGHDPEIRALLDTIASHESTGYDSMYSGSGRPRRFSDFSDHPRSGDRIVFGPNAGKTSAAAGRYQHTPATWDRQARKLRLTDFSPESQDISAADLAETTYGSGLLDALRTDDDNSIADVGRKLNGQWTSLPGGSESSMTDSDFVNTYRRNLAKYKGGNVSEPGRGTYYLTEEDLVPKGQETPEPLQAQAPEVKPSVFDRVLNVVDSIKNNFEPADKFKLPVPENQTAEYRAAQDPNSPEYAAYGQPRIVGMDRAAYPGSVAEKDRVEPDHDLIQMNHELGVPVKPGYIDKVREAYEAAAPDLRQKMIETQGPLGAVSRYVDKKYQGGFLANTDLGGRVEDIAARNRVNGMEPKSAQVMAQREADFNADPIIGQAYNTELFSEHPFDSERAKELRTASPIVRGAIQSVDLLKQQAAGLHKMIADVGESIGVPGSAGYGRAQMEARKRLGTRQAEMGEASNDFNRNLEGAIASTISNAPGYAVGLFTGGQTVPLLMMSTQVAGDEYAAGIEHGLTKPQALVRSVGMGAAEYLGEKLGFKDQVDMLKRVAGGNWREFEKHFVKTMAEQIVGEEGTTLAQFGIDKSRVGINPEATAQDLFDQVKDTLHQTVLQTALMGAPGSAAAVHRKLKEGDSRYSQGASNPALSTAESRAIYDQTLGTPIQTLLQDPEYKEIFRNQTNIDDKAMDRGREARRILADKRATAALSSSSSISEHISSPGVTGETNAKSTDVSNPRNEGRAGDAGQTETGRQGGAGRVQQESTHPSGTQNPSPQTGKAPVEVVNAQQKSEAGAPNGGSSSQSGVRQEGGSAGEGSQRLQSSGQENRNLEEAPVGPFSMHRGPGGITIVDGRGNPVSVHKSMADAVEAHDQLTAQSSQQEYQDELQTSAASGNETGTGQIIPGSGQQAAERTEQGSGQEAQQEGHHGLKPEAESLLKQAEAQDALGNAVEAQRLRILVDQVNKGEFVPEAYLDANNPDGNAGSSVSESSGGEQSSSSENRGTGSAAGVLSGGKAGAGTSGVSGQVSSETGNAGVRGNGGLPVKATSGKKSAKGVTLTPQQEGELSGHNTVLRKLGKPEMTPEQYLAEQQAKLQPAGSNRAVSDQEVIDDYNSDITRHNEIVDADNAAIDARGTGESKKVPRSHVRVATSLPSRGLLQRRTAESIAKIFGHKVIFVEHADGPGHRLDIDGAITGRHKNHILIAADSQEPLSRIAFHELVHGLRRNAPHIYGQLVRNLREHYNPLAVAQHLNERGYSPDLPAPSDNPEHFTEENRNEEEWVADHLSDIIHDHEAVKALSDRMEGQKAGTGRAFLQHIRHFYESVISRLKGAGFGTESAVAAKHLRKSRDAVVEALAAYHALRSEAEKPKAKEDDWIGQLFSQEGSASEENGSDNSGLVQDLRDHADRKRAEANDWNTRKYKSNKRSIDLEGDGTKRNETASVSALNESRRRRMVESLQQQAQMASNLANRIERGRDVKSEVAKIIRGVDARIALDGKPTIGNSRNDQIESAISSELLGDKRGSYGDGSVARMVREAYAEHIDIPASNRRTEESSDVHRLHMVAQRNERETGKQLRLSEEEKALIASSAEQHGIPEKTILDAVRQHKLAHPPSQGWSPLTYKRSVKNDKGKLTHEYEITPYGFSSDAAGKQLTHGTPAYEARAKKVALGLVSEVRKVFLRAKDGDQNAKAILAQAGWYKAMRSRLRSEFGGLGDLFADLLGATSPNTPVRENWKNAVDVLRRATRGDFDELMPKWIDRYARIDDLESRLRGIFNDKLNDGLTKKAIKQLPEYVALRKEISDAKEFPKDLLPSKESGALYGFNGRNATRALVDLWRVVRDADPDIGRGGTAPKALNFSGNLIGFREKATIDVWAARMLQRLAGLSRIPSMSESGVSGEMRESGDTTLQFGFGQDVFNRATRMIRNDSALRADANLAGINDDDLQAVVWFIEKELWTNKNWTSAAGEGGSFELEASLTGSKEQSEIRKLRKIIDSSKSTQEAKDKAKSDLARYERTADRFIGGLSVAQSQELQGKDFVPSDAEMNRLSKEIAAAIHAGSDGSTVLGAKVVSTEGMYGNPIRAFDIEAVTTEGYDPGHLWVDMLKKARDAKQESVFLSRILRPDEAIDYATHRPGIEVYFRDMVSRDKLDEVLAQLKAKGADFFTVVTDGRRMPGAMAGAMPPAVGIRMQYIPEFEHRYGRDDLSALTDEKAAKIVEKKELELIEIAHNILADVPNISFAGRFWYETQVAFSHEYEDLINGYPAGKLEEIAGAPRGQRWAGQPVKAGVASADRQLREAARRESDGQQPIPVGRNDIPASIRRNSTVRDDAVHRARRDAGTSLQEPPRSYLREGRGDGKSVRLLGNTQVSVAADWRPSESTLGAFNESSMKAPSFLELRRGSLKNADAFASAITDSKNASPFGAAVYVYPVSEYRKMKLFLSEDGKSGVAVKPDGDVVSVFGAGGTGDAIMQLAISAGGKKLDAFDTILPDLYNRHGFVAVARTPWNDEFAPEGWNKETFADFNGGEPDVVFMVYKPSHFGIYTTADGTKFHGDDGYDKAVEAQEKAVSSSAALAGYADDIVDLPPDIPASIRRNSRVGININDDTQDFTQQILSGVKTVETRNSPSLRPYIGKRVGIVKTGKGKPAELVGFARITGEKRYKSAEEFDADYAAHKVAPDSPFHSGGIKFGYTIENAKAISPIRLSSKGIVARSLPEDLDIPASNRRQTETPAFKRWFGDSKVVDESGKPRIVYHGTRVQGPLKDGKVPGDIKVFDRLFSTNWRSHSIDTVGSWFSTNPSDDGAQMYSGKSEDSVIYPVYLSIQNPHTTTFQLMLRRARLLANGKDDGRMVGEEEVNAYRKWLKATGKDGIHIVHDEGAPNGSTEFKGQDAWIVLEPNQIKSATGNNGAFSPTNPDIRFSNRRPVFYSALERAIGSSKLETQPATQWRAWLQSNKAKLGVKDEEIAWTGLDDYLQLKGKDRLTKDDIRAFLQDNGIQVKEVVKGEDQEAIKASFKAAQKEADDAGEKYQDAQRKFLNKVAPGQLEAANVHSWIGDILNGRDYDARLYDESEEKLTPYIARDPEGFQKIKDLWKEYSSLDAKAEGIHQSFTPTKYGIYQLPGGSNYRELLLTLPDKSKPEPKSRPQVVDRGHDEYGRAQYDVTRDGEVIDTFSTWSAAEEYVQELEQSDKESVGVRYRSSHWDEPNILAHIRFNDRTDADGHKVLFVEELQSDWAQEGRKKGFTPRIQKTFKRWMREDKGIQDEGLIDFEDQNPHMSENFDEWAALQGQIQSAPFVRDTKSWLSLALKRIIRYAAEGDYGKVAFVNGEQSASRYDLSSQVNSIVVPMINEDGSRSVRIDANSGQFRLMVDKQGNVEGHGSHSEQFNGKTLDEVVGKEIADKIMAVKPYKKVSGKVVESSDGSWRVDWADGTFSGGYDKANAERRASEGKQEGSFILEGDGLRVGGEGMKSFYDRIVPQTINEVLKKIGGGKVAPTDISDKGYKFEEMTRWDGPEWTIDQVQELYDLSKKSGPGIHENPLTGRRESFQINLVSNMYGIRRLLDNMKNGSSFSEAIVDPDISPGVTELFGGQHTTIPESERPKRTISQLGFTVTESMRDKVLEGLPMFSNRRNVMDQKVASTWRTPGEHVLDNLIYTMQDKLVDTKRVQQSIERANRTIEDEWNPYQKEMLYHGRSAKLTQDFLVKEIKPLFKAMADENVTMEDLEAYLWNRHAEERNDQVASINPGMPDAGSGIETLEARNYLRSLSNEDRVKYERLARMVDKITEGTRKLLVKSGLETQDTVLDWQNTYQHYVPLQRSDVEGSTGRLGTGQGFSIKGSSVKRAMGSDKPVVDILANLMMQRERTIVRAEKNRVALALYGLAIQNENPDFWLPVNPDAMKAPVKTMHELMNLGLDALDFDGLMKEPTVRAINPKTGLVETKINPVLRNRDNVLAVRINGKDRFLFFNQDDPRALRMVESLKNLDADQVGTILNWFRIATRWFASVNTQYNPIFGIVNLTRDVGGGAINLTSTKIAGKEAQVLKHLAPAIAGIYRDLRADRAGKQRSGSSWSTLWEEFQGVGGKTGYRDLYMTSEDRAKALQKEIDAIYEGAPKKFFKGIFNWLSDYNETLENGVRLAAYKVARDQGMTKDQAASLAKNLTVNFNKKGQIAQQAGSLYAFFNASVQGTARLAETLAGPAGKKIVTGGLLLGASQAILLAAAGLDDDEPPQFVRERNIIIPTGNKGFITIPMPLGLHVIPNTGRVLTEIALNGGEDVGKQLVGLLGSYIDAFDPMGSSGMSIQTLTPTLIDPLAALAENRDSFGKEIAKKDRSSLAPTPGFTRAKETASVFGHAMSKAINYIFGGTQYVPGEFSPTPDQVDFLIGQVTGGVGREALKVDQTVRSLISGEELPPHKIPLVGRFYGTSKSQSAESGKFYSNLTMLNKHEAQMKGMSEEGADVDDYIQKNPEAVLAEEANTVERVLTKLKTQKRLMLSNGADRAEIKSIEGEITSLMRDFNSRVKESREAPNDRRP